MTKDQLIEAKEITEKIKTLSDHLNEIDSMLSYYKTTEANNASIRLFNLDARDQGIKLNQNFLSISAKEIVEMYKIKVKAKITELEIKFRDL